MVKTKTKSKRGRPDYLTLILVGLLVLIGLQAVHSATLGLAQEEYGNPHHYLLRQGAWAAIGSLALLLGMVFNYRWLRPLSPLIMLAAIAALGATLHPRLGVSTYGATRWLQLGPLPPLQPSEFAKLALIIYMSVWLASQKEKIKSFTHGVIPFVLIVGVVGGLVMAQPDMGTTIVIVLTAVTLFFLAGASLRHLFVLGGAGVAAGLLLIILAPYRLERIICFFGNCGDPRGSDFHIIQAGIALGSGGITGRGLGASRQKFFYLPDSHTDSIFAVIGEEVGFVGSVAVIILIALLVYRGFRLASASDDAFAALLAAGISSWIAYQALINIGGITRSIPLTGITLPFISFGGSSLIAFMAAVGIMLNISRHRSQDQHRQGPAPPAVSGG